MHLQQDPVSDFVIHHCLQVSELTYVLEGSYTRHSLIFQSASNEVVISSDFVLLCYYNKVACELVCFFTVSSSLSSHLDWRRHK